MLDQDLLDWTTANYEAIAAAAESGAHTEIRSCPGWTMSDLLSHASNTINGWFAYNVAREPDDHGAGSGMRSAPPEPEGWAERLAHLRSGARRFEDIVHNTDLDRPVWTFGLPHGRARFWLGRAATESAIHRWDAEGSVGAPRKMPAPLAAASIDETFRGIWRWVYLETAGGDSRRFGSITIPTPPAALGIHAIDSGARWLLQANPEERIYEVISDGAMPDTVVSGDGDELVRFLWGRNGTLPPTGETGPNGLPVHPGATVRNAAGLTVSGAPDIVDAWNFGVLAQV
jgi:uncharacterized protein (TIGR03083 family)